VDEDEDEEIGAEELAIDEEVEDEFKTAAVKEIEEEDDETEDEIEEEEDGEIEEEEEEEEREEEDEDEREEEEEEVWTRGVLGRILAGGLIGPV